MRSSRSLEMEAPTSLITSGPVLVYPLLRYKAVRSLYFPPAHASKLALGKGRKWRSRPLSKYCHSWFGRLRWGGIRRPGQLILAGKCGYCKWWWGRIVFPGTRLRPLLWRFGRKLGLFGLRCTSISADPVSSAPLSVPGVTWSPPSPQSGRSNAAPALHNAFPCKPRTQWASGRCRCSKSPRGVRRKYGRYTSQPFCYKGEALAERVWADLGLRYRQEWVGKRRLWAGLPNSRRRRCKDSR